MKFDRKEWDFPALIWEYCELRFYFKSNEIWDSYPWYTQVELKKVCAVLNAITGCNYIVETLEGKKEIEDAFYHGFGLGSNLYTEEQAEQLKSLMKCTELFKYLGRMHLPLVGDFYNELYLAYQAGHKYITQFDFVNIDIKRNDDVFKIIDEFKFQKQDKFIYRMNRIIVKAMIILLGENFARTFTTAELIEKYNYPDVENQEIEKAKIALLEARWRDYD